MKENRKHILTSALETDDAFFKFLRQEAASLGYRKLREQMKIDGRHPSGEMLHDYVMDELDEESARHLRGHLLLCHPCTDGVLRLLMRIEDELDQTAMDRANEMTGERPGEGPVSVIDALASWISRPWEPRWAGQPVTASDIPEQEHSFRMDDGEIRLSCNWREAHGEYPAYIRVAWEADIMSPSNIEARFTEPETRKIRAQVRLGTHLAGERTFTSDDLGFDPSRERWAVAVILTEEE